MENANDLKPLPVSRRQEAVPILEGRVRLASQMAMSRSRDCDRTRTQANFVTSCQFYMLTVARTRPFKRANSKPSDCVRCKPLGYCLAVAGEQVCWQLNVVRSHFLRPHNDAGLTLKLVDTVAVVPH